MKNYQSVFLFILTSIIFTLFVFWPSLFLSFVQDDFYLLVHSNIGDAGNIGKLFLPQMDTIWYRPLSQYVFFYIMQSLFGLHPFPFHIVLFFVHWVNAILVFLILKKLFNNQVVSFVGGVVYVLHPLQFLSLVWPAAFGFVLGPFFFLITIYASLFLLKKITLRASVFVYILYLLSLFTIEVNLILVLVLPLLALFVSKSKKYALSFFIAGFIPVICILYLRLVLYPAHIGGDYVMSLGGLGSSLRYYVLRIAGIPYIYRQLKPTLLLGLSLLTGFLFLYFFFPWVRGIKIKKPLFLFGLTLSCLGIAPFLLMPQHLSPHYAVYSLIGIIIFVSALWAGFMKEKQTFNFTHIGTIFVLALLILSKALFEIEWQTHWIIARAKLADRLLKQHIYIAPVGTEEYFALGANSAGELYTSKIIK